MHKPESVLENETHKIFWDFEIQTDHLIAARRLNLVIVNKKKEHLPNSVFCRPSGPQSENQRKQKKEIYLDLARELKKAMESQV